MDMSNLPTSRAAAKAAGAAFYFTGEPCKHGHIAPRKVKGSCTECLREAWAREAVTRAEYFQRYNRSAAGHAAKARYYEANREVVIAKAKATPNEIKNQYRQAWAERNVGTLRALTKARRRKHRQATPAWLTYAQRAEIVALYRIAGESSRITGDRYVVDHIYPLQSDAVCGLHVPWNLRVITQRENATKSNRMPDESYDIAFPRGR